MNNRETSVEDAVFEYTGDGCSVPKDVISVRVKEGVQKIGAGAFYYCRSLESVTIPSTVTEIGHGAFNSCCDLREVALNNGLPKIGRYAFYNCTSLQSIKLPSTVTEIDYAFSYCTNLNEVTFNDGLQKIGDKVFQYCTSLESITLPSTVVEIGAGLLYSCCNLREVRLNEGLKKVGDGAFRNCHALERFLFPTISYRFENLIQTNHWENLEDKLNQVRGVMQWESNKLFVLGATVFHNWNETKRDLDRITRLVSYYELKEAASTFELALWKSKLDQADATSPTNRAAYRIDVPGPVKDTIFQYLDHTC